MNLWPMVAIISFAALLHASFQLGVSLLTMLSSHSLGSQRSHSSLLKLNVAYIFGVGFMSLLLFLSLGYLAALISQPREPIIAWIVVASLTIGIGLAVMLFYFRRSKGTELWVPRSIAQYLSAQTKKTSHSAEAFTLGIASVVGEALFIVGPMSVAVLYLIRFSPAEQLLGVCLYVAVALLPLLFITAMIGSGHKMSTIQRWRERNKRFLQYTAGSGLIIFGLFIFVTEVVSALAFEGVTIL